MRRAEDGMNDQNVCSDMIDDVCMITRFFIPQHNVLQMRATSSEEIKVNIQELVIHDFVEYEVEFMYNNPNFNYPLYLNLFLQN
jgi:hypothetical protein